MRVLVTGNLGYIGPVVTAALKRAGHYVVGLDTGWFLPNLASIPVYPDEQIFGDIREERVRWLDPNVVVHLAGLSNDPMGDLDPALTTAINIDGTNALLAGAPARHVIVSSCSVYGTAGIATEETSPAPLTAYARAKWRVDTFATVIDNAVSLRLGTVFGWSPGHRLDLVVNRMTYDATHSRGITVNGNVARPLIHVEDVASAIGFMLERPETGIFNVVGENIFIRDLASIVAAETKAKIREQSGGADARDYMADGSKLRALGWAPRHTVESSLPDLAERTADLGTPYRYERLTALKRLIDSGYLDPNLRHPAERAA